ncbi:MAG: (2Fe-2S)-binding protein [Myxococcota bacterium]|nr:(2Fe-2S)-binding protein [Myxococcota bacterium]
MSSRRSSTESPAIELIVNGEHFRVSVEPDTPLLWVLREQLHLNGAKFGCGVGLCGTCSVHLDGRLVRSCRVPVSAAAARQVTTIEGLAADPEHPVVRAWIEERVSQCGYCQPGQVMAAAALLSANPQPTDREIDAAMDGNLCRCGTYPRIRRAIRRASGRAHGG